MLPKRIGKITIHIEDISFGDVASVLQSIVPDLKPKPKAQEHPLVGATVTAAAVQPEGYAPSSAFWMTMQGKKGQITRVIPHYQIAGDLLLDVQFPGEPFPHEEVWSKRLVAVDSLTHPELQEFTNAFAKP